MDVRLLRYSFDRNPDWPTEITVAENGEEAIHSLLSPSAAKPDLVILDLNLPKKDGTEVLRVIRTESSAPDVPVIVFSSSPEDVIRTKVNKANVRADCYITKPMGLELFADLAYRFRNCYEGALKRSSKSAGAPG